MKLQDCMAKLESRLSCHGMNTSINAVLHEDASRSIA